jgi:hypothetical protein
VGKGGTLHQAAEHIGPVDDSAAHERYRGEDAAEGIHCCSCLWGPGAGVTASRVALLIMAFLRDLGYVILGCLHCRLSCELRTHPARSPTTHVAEGTAQIQPVVTSLASADLLD